MANEDISKVAEVVGVATKKDGTELRGIGKNGKEWVLYTVILENGVKMNTFAPVSVGDIMFNLKQDEQYHTWKGELKRQGNGTQPATSSTVDKSQPTLAMIYHEILETKKIMQKLAEAPKQEDNLPDDDEVDGEPIDLPNIPF